MALASLDFKTEFCEKPYHAQPQRLTFCSRCCGVLDNNPLALESSQQRLPLTFYESPPTIRLAAALGLRRPHANVAVMSSRGGPQ